MDESQWLISRIELLHSTVIDEIQTIGKRFEGIGKTEILRLKGRRNNILSILGITLTIMLGIYSVKPISDFWVFLIFSIITALAIMTFILFNKMIIEISNTFVIIHNAFIESEGHVNFSRGYIIGKTASLSLVNYDFLKNYFAVSAILSLAVYVPVIQALQKSKSKWINPDIKNALIENMNTFKEIVKIIPKDVEKVDLTQDLPDNTTEFIKNAVQECNRK